MLNYDTYLKQYFTHPTPPARYAYGGLYGMTLFFSDYAAAVAYYQAVLGPPAYAKGAYTRGWQIGSTWLTLLKGEHDNPHNLEVTFVMQTPGEAERLQAAFIATGGTGEPPCDQLMYTPVRYCPVKDPFGTPILIICPLGQEGSSTIPMQSQEQSLSEYDRLARQYGYVLPEAVFGLCYEYLKPGQRLLDIGIGTGLSALPFTRADISVYGMDNSPEMLSICRDKGFAVELRQADICVKPWPYPDGFFDLVIACGLTHFIQDLEPIFQETARLLRLKGIFAYTIKEPGDVNMPEVIQRGYSTEWIEGTEIFSHHRTYYEKMASACGFMTQKELRVQLTRGAVDQDDVYTVYIAQKAGN